MSEIRVAVLTISDRCAKNEAADLSGPALVEMINGGAVAGAKVASTGLVPDDVDLIQAQIKKWCDEDDVDVVLTTGGSGLGPRDVTPEATVPLVRKLVPGIPMLMFKKSSEITPLAALSRSLAGVRGNTLIVNLPGSKKAATECLEAIACALPHACDVVRDRKSEISATHSLARPTRKSRVRADAEKPNRSPYPLVSVPDAQNLILKRIFLLKKECTVPVEDACGYYLAQDLIARDNLPPFDASLKDGYALIAGDNPTTDDTDYKYSYTVIGNSYSGSLPDLIVEKGTCVKISTGAPLPRGANAVLQVEDTESTREEGRVTMKTNKSVVEGQDVRPKGSDFQKGELLLETGSYVNASCVGLLAAVGTRRMRVSARPTVAIFSTGDELVEPGTVGDLPPGKVRDSNRATLSSLLKEEKFTVVDFGIVSDTPDALCETLDKAFREADVVVTTGSMSMGDKDYVKEVLVEDFGAEMVFGRVFMKPGKPTAFALVAFEGKHKAWFGLPGNPASAFVTAHLFVLPALRKISGCTNPSPQVFSAVLKGCSIASEERPNYQRGSLYYDLNYEKFYVTPTGNQSSSRIASCALSNCLLEIPEGDSKRTSYTPGCALNVYLVGKLPQS